MCVYIYIHMNMKYSYECKYDLNTNHVGRFLKGPLKGEVWLLKINRSC